MMPLRSTLAKLPLLAVLCVAGGCSFLSMEPEVNTYSYAAKAATMSPCRPLGYQNTFNWPGAWGAGWRGQKTPEETALTPQERAEFTHQKAQFCLTGCGYRLGNGTGGFRLGDLPD